MFFFLLASFCLFPFFILFSFQPTNRSIYLSINLSIYLFHSLPHSCFFLFSSFHLSFLFSSFHLSFLFTYSFSHHLHAQFLASQFFLQSSFSLLVCFLQTFPLSNKTEETKRTKYVALTDRFISKLLAVDTTGAYDWLVGRFICLTAYQPLIGYVIPKFDSFVS